MFKFFRRFPQHVYRTYATKIRPPPSYITTTSIITMTGLTIGIAQCQEQPHQLPKWARTLESNFTNVSDEWLENLPTKDAHFIHSIHIPGRYEQFHVYADHQEKATHAFVRIGSDMCGHPGIVHGGCIASVIDELCGWTLGIAHLGYSVTVNLNVNYRNAISAETDIYVHTKIDKIERRKIYLTSVVGDGKDKVFAEATAIFVIPKDKVELKHVYPPQK